MLVKDEAVCIRAVDYSETSQVVTFFTRATGKISAIAKGSKRPKSTFDGPIEMLSYGKIVFSDSTREKLATLTEFEQQPTQYEINLFVLNCCLFAAELVNKLTDDYDPHPSLFDSLIQFLNGTRETSPAPRRGWARHERRETISLLILFQLTLLKEVGLQPVLNSCVNCKTQHAIRDTQYEAYFSSSANGLICRDCEASFPDRIKLTRKAADCLVNVKLLAETDEKTLNEIEKVLVYHFTELLHKPPKMAKYILR